MIRATFAGFNTALTALRSNQKKLDVTGQNLANMTTEGYTRQELHTSSINYENPTSFYMNENDTNVGYGVSMDAVTQMRDQFLDSQYRTENAKVGYNDTIADSLGSLSTFLDETKLDGLRTSFDNIQTALTNMQDPAKVNDPVYEGELRSRMQATTNLFNQAATQIQTSMKNEYQKLDGTGSSENGAVDTINQLLADIGDLNIRIKKNQLLGNSALELQDERNLKLDQLSSYIPIEVSYFTEKYEEAVTKADGTTQTITKDKGLNYDMHGNAVGKSAFPEDLKIELVYKAYDANGANPKEQRITLVNGSFAPIDANGNVTKNYGSVKIQVDGVDAYDQAGNRTAAYYDGKTNPDTGKVQQVQLTFTKAASYTYTDDGTNTGRGKDSNGNLALHQQDSMTTDTQATDTDRSVTRFDSGSVQAGLDMLSDSYSSLNNGSVYRSYDYYMNRLDTLASTFALQMNRYNQMGVNNTYDTRDAAGNPVGAVSVNGATKSGTTLTPEEMDAITDTVGSAGSTNKNFLLLVNAGIENGALSQKASGIKASNITVSSNWINGTVHVGTYGDPNKGNSSTDTTLHMLRSMSATLHDLGNKSYADEMNSISTYLATDSYNNGNTQKTNQAVLNGIATSKDQISGVSLDEEAANMMTYVTSYNAAARLMSALDDTLQTLMSIAQ